MIVCITASPSRPSTSNRGTSRAEGGAVSPFVVVVVVVVATCGGFLLRLFLEFMVWYDNNAKISFMYLVNARNSAVTLYFPL